MQVNFQFSPKQKIKRFRNYTKFVLTISIVFHESNLHFTILKNIENLLKHSQCKLYVKHI